MPMDRKSGASSLGVFQESYAPFRFDPYRDVYSWNAPLPTPVPCPTPVPSLDYVEQQMTTRESFLLPRGPVLAVKSSEARCPPLPADWRERIRRKLKCQETETAFLGKGTVVVDPKACRDKVLDPYISGFRLQPPVAQNVVAGIPIVLTPELQKQLEALSRADTPEEKRRAAEGADLEFFAAQVQTFLSSMSGEALDGAYKTAESLQNIFTRAARQYGLSGAKSARMSPQARLQLLRAFKKRLLAELRAKVGPQFAKDFERAIGHRSVLKEGSQIANRMKRKGANVGKLGAWAEGLGYLLFVYDAGTTTWKVVKAIDAPDAERVVREELLGFSGATLVGMFGTWLLCSAVTAGLGAVACALVVGGVGGVAGNLGGQWLANRWTDREEQAGQGAWCSYDDDLR